MNIEQHGLAIGIQRVDQRFFLSIKAQGKLSHEDYQTITPLLDSALGEVRAPRVRALIDVSELQGWEARAAWDDFKIGLKHGNEFERIAIVGSHRWQQIAARVGSWFVGGQMRSFEQSDEAMRWLNED